MHAVVRISTIGTADILCNNFLLFLQARVLVMLCIARSEGRHGCLQSKEETRIQKLLKQQPTLVSALGGIAEQKI